jgi:uncharacterized protein (UPF0261 family)
MQVLPIGFPKVMVTTIASGNMRPFLLTKDITVFPAVTGVFVLDFVFNQILNNAVHDLIGMVKGYRPLRRSDKMVIGATACGVTTAGLMKMKRLEVGRQRAALIQPISCLFSETM